MARTGTTPEQMFGQRREQLARLHRSGVILLMGTDGGINQVKAHGIIDLSIAEHLRAGIPAAEVLRGATSAAAAACGPAASKGRLRVGYDADLVVIGTDPRMDAAALSDVRVVVLRGRTVIGPAAGPSG